MSQPSPDDQLIELLLQLRRTTPEQARQILNAQPQLSYLLIQLMVKMNAINLEVLQKTLATYIPGAQPVRAAAPAPTIPVVPPSAIPPHMAPSSQFRTSTPPYQGTPPSAAYPQFQGAPPPQVNPYGPPSGGIQGFQGGPPAGYQGAPPGFQGAPPTSFPGAAPSAPAPPPASGPPGLTADTLAAMPEQQRAMITRIITMTPESIRVLPPQERDTINQIRATLGLPTG
ncbi:hypothetical protein OE88DRAFT_1730276 [Heliocybe sulcata]|uniref:Cleavage stimulation factor subunit 2 hinge domain-containing protein n=1 Tax=Heliocybe sulcata TaxID=5364 RepID=A0A5C3NGE8_9AGAM|nr:hypothetical protein OE88DRAFT_1730276 [Heliocybe sulcata]